MQCMPGRDGKGKFTAPSQFSKSQLGSPEEVEAENIPRKNVLCDIYGQVLLPQQAPPAMKAN